ncbi:MAG: aspartate/glutamate racemase family protein [Deltaproteobacteria bacterium]|nr:aspartate/glutamate racemase family protein [Deltaproteobacteria bacterium]
MKTIGLLGGMSWESTVSYYQAINRGIAARLGGLHSAKMLLYSTDFEEIELLQRQGNWDRAGAELAAAARSLEGAGADFIVLATNTMHKVAPAIEDALTIPFLHIADATAAKIASAGLEKVGLLGTRFTMEQDFYRGRLCETHGLEVLIPPEQDRARVHAVIYDELCHGEIRPGSRAEYRRIVDDLVAQGADGVILGCTEIGLLIDQQDAAVPLFDTAQIHAECAVEHALAD